ncbi:MAG TPA: hypothetical protein VNT20_09715 [Flavisolibacter sp.]|jgi:uncharacterized membrane protein|nr:hypothetical protein [Flavisolibacter sp.]
MIKKYGWFIIVLLLVLVIILLLIIFTDVHVAKINREIKQTSSITNAENHHPSITKL